MPQPPTKAFVLAAGIGERMRPLTDACPKPLLEVGGCTMLDRTLDALDAAGVKDVVVNTFYLARMIEERLKTRKQPRITVSHEEKLLDTGGGVRRRLDFFGDEPFFVLNADVVWTDGPVPALSRMAKMWDGAAMDLLLLLHPAQDIPVYAGHGDYYLADGSSQPVFKKRSAQPANYIFAGPRIVHPRAFADEGREVFSFVELFHKAEASGRLFALRHDGEWHHVGTPEAFEETNRILGAQGGKSCAG